MTQRDALENFCKYAPEDDRLIVGTIGYELEMVGDAFLGRDARAWLERRRAYCREREAKQDA